MKNFIESGIIAPQDLHNLLSNNTPNIALLDATFVLPTSEYNPKAAFERERIAHAQFFDIKSIADDNSDIPHMLPSPDAFEKFASNLGINNSDLIIIYSTQSMTMGPPRAWWTLKCFGHKNVCVLNGGLQAWKAENLEVNTSAPTVPDKSFFEAKFNPNLIRDLNDMMKASNDGNTLILDARPQTRFAGSEPEPRSDLRSGCIPNSKNLPCSTLIDTHTGKLKCEEDLRNMLAAAGYAKNQPTITTCGSGVTACMLALALHHIGEINVPVYDGSWSEWGLKSKGTPIQYSKP